MAMASHEKFSNVMHANGSSRDFREETAPEQNSNATAEDRGSTAGDSNQFTQEDRASSAGEFGQLTTPDSDRDIPSTRFPELIRLFNNEEPLPVKEQEPILTWITRTYRRFKGFEIGTTNPSLLPSLFIEQSRPWHHYATKHVQNVISQIHRFLRELLE